MESASSASTGQWMGDSYPRDFSNTVLGLALPASARERLADQLPLHLLTQPSGGISAPAPPTELGRGGESTPGPARLKV